MSFNVKMIFNGLCAYVPDEELGSEEVSPSRMTVLMPNAGRTSQKVRGLDGRKLRNHYPVLKFFSGNLLERGSMPGNAEMQWHLDGMEVTFEIQEVYPGLNRFKVIQNLEVDEQISRSRKDFNWGAHLVEVSPIFPRLTRRFFPNLMTEEIGQSVRALCSLKVRCLLMTLRRELHGNSIPPWVETSCHAHFRMLLPWILSI